MKTKQTEKTQSSMEDVSIEHTEEDSFAKKTPIKRLAKRSTEVNHIVFSEKILSCSGVKVKVLACTSAY